jgi:light-regulated signal transduction histidine kinase (bacteriophytochrome)
MAAQVLSGHAAAEPQRGVTWAVAPGLVAHGDARLVGVLLENLLGNSWKFTRKVRNATITVGRQGPPGEAVFTVQDNGAGFDMAHAGKLFQPFQRLHHASEFEGTGIGLATVQRIVQRHGGRVWVESRPGMGSTFYFTLGPAR